MAKQPLTIALVGNPNTGKTTIFNSLTGMRQKIGNYPGVTVERKVGTSIIAGVLHQVIDLPGAYSLNYKKLDERITYEALLGTFEHEKTPDLILMVVDASNLDRNLYLATQVMDLGIPMMLVLNMADVADENGIKNDVKEIEKQLGIPTIAISAKKSAEVEKLKTFIGQTKLVVPKPTQWLKDEVLQQAATILVKNWIAPYTNIPERAFSIEALRLISEGEITEVFYEYSHTDEAEAAILQARIILEQAGRNPMAEEVLQRYNFIGDCTSVSSQKTNETKRTLTDKIDAVVTHKICGPAIFVGILLVMFQAIFSWATPFMDLIDALFINTGSWVANTLPEGMLNDLLVDGVIAGLGGVIIFLPQILFLFFFIYVLEGTGYMARAAFVMDGFMTKVGLHGRSVVPLMSGFACAIPGIMATRTIENWRDRIITIMVLPFMACSARLPVYALLIAAFVPAKPVLGIFTMQGVTFFALYIFGIVTAIIAAATMKRFFPKGKQTPFIMELPAYKMPKWDVVLHNVWDRGKIFVTEAGKVIVALSIVLWFLASFPAVNSDEAEANKLAGETVESYQLRHSYAGKFGHFIEPVIEPMGFDWKIGISLLTSFAAREVMVGTLNTIYSIEDDGEDFTSLRQKLIEDVNPKTGKPVYTLATALALMVFFALAMQCMSTLAIVKRETNSWKWPVSMFAYMGILAYVAAFLTFHIITRLM